MLLPLPCIKAVTLCMFSSTQSPTIHIARLLLTVQRVVVNVNFYIRKRHETEVDHTKTLPTQTASFCVDVAFGLPIAAESNIPTATSILGLDNSFSESVTARCWLLITSPKGWLSLCRKLLHDRSSTKICTLCFIILFGRKPTAVHMTCTHVH